MIFINKTFLCALMSLVFAVWARFGMCQTSAGSLPGKERSNITCQLAKVTPSSRFASTLMFFMGNFIIVVLCAGLIVFALSLLPKRAHACPVSILARAGKAELLHRDGKISIHPGSLEFNAVIANLSDERQQPDFQTASVTIHMYVNAKRYVIQISMAGWNFLNEERNSRRLINSMEAVKALDSLIKRPVAP